MRTPPPIPAAEIADAVESAYGILAPTLTFVRGGEDAWAYKVASPSGAYHLKIYRDHEHLSIRLSATYALRHDHGIKAVIAPLTTEGNHLWIEIAGSRAALFPFVFGATSRAQPMTTAQGRAFGALLAQIHHTELDITELPFETFSTAEADAAERVIDTLPDAAGGAHRVRRQLAALMLPAERRLRAEIARLREAAAEALDADAPLCVCHGDPTSDNILIGQTMMLIDWDDMLLAPKEKDLMHFRDGHPVRIGYEEATGDSTLDDAVLRYYRALWNNQEIADFGGRILFHDLSPTQFEHDLAQMENFLRYSGLGSRR